MKKAVALIGLLVVSCTHAPPRMHRVNYDVEGTATVASLTMSNAQGGTEQTRVRLPFHSQFSAPEGALVYLAAQNERGGPIISCSIGIDGIGYRFSSSGGRYAIASCNGEVGDQGAAQ